MEIKTILATPTMIQTIVVSDPGDEVDRIRR